MYNKELSIKKCSENDIDDILNLQEYVIDHLEDKSVLRRNTKAMFLHCMQEPNLTLGVYHQNEMIALSIFVDERGTSEDLSTNIKKEANDVCANFKLVIVRDDFRGRHLQSNLMWILERYAYEHGYTKLCTTVSPDNLYSLNNIEKLQYQFELEAVKYGGLRRYLYVKDIKKFSDAKNKELEKQLEEYEKTNTLINLELNDYYTGQENIVFTGDVVEYSNASNEPMYGIYFKRDTTTPTICLFDTKNKKVVITEFSKTINDYHISNYYISCFKN